MEQVREVSPRVRGAWVKDMPEHGIASARFDAIVVGAGQAGLAAGYELQRAGLSFAILEAGARPVGSWPHYYDSLRLFSPARYSALPGLPFPGDPDHYPSRDEVVAYLQAYAAHFALPVITAAQVERVSRKPDFEVTTTSGLTYISRSVIAATGAFHRPYLPEILGQADYRGTIIHSAAYRDPVPWRKQQVVVVGGGNSAVQIGVELARVAHVTLATRRPLRLVPQRVLGRDLHFWLRLSGVEALPLGRWISLREANPVLDTGGYRAALERGKPGRRPMFVRFSPHGVVWADGTEEPVDAVIFATGYRPNLGYLAGLGALDAQGRARQQAGISLTTPGLYYVGLPAQRTFASATLRGVGSDAAYVVRHLQHWVGADRTRQRPGWLGQS